MDLQPDPGALQGESPQNCRNTGGIDVICIPDLQMSGISFCGISCELRCLLHLFQDLLRAFVKDTSGVGQTDRTAGAVKQFCMQFFLQGMVKGLIDKFMDTAMQHLKTAIERS